MRHHRGGQQTAAFKGGHVGRSSSPFKPLCDESPAARRRIQPPMKSQENTKPQGKNETYAVPELPRCTPDRPVPLFTTKVGRACYPWRVVNPWLNYSSDINRTIRKERKAVPGCIIHCHRRIGAGSGVASARSRVTASETAAHLHATHVLALSTANGQDERLLQKTADSVRTRTPPPLSQSLVKDKDTQYRLFPSPSTYGRVSWIAAGVQTRSGPSYSTSESAGGPYDGVQGRAAAVSSRNEVGAATRPSQGYISNLTKILRPFGACELVHKLASLSPFDASSQAICQKSDVLYAIPRRFYGLAGTELNRWMGLRTPGISLIEEKPAASAKPGVAAMICGLRFWVCLAYLDYDLGGTHATAVNTRVELSRRTRSQTQTQTQARGDRNSSKKPEPDVADDLRVAGGSGSADGV
ncbi:hypothetical protein C8R46DRAFT_1189459 [Mycena filopes]|nr:hypothetical protein C8R46DRAFT_1189459 [Mycena filopes]